MGCVCGGVCVSVFVHRSGRLALVKSTGVEMHTFVCVCARKCVCVCLHMCVSRCTLIQSQQPPSQMNSRPIETEPFMRSYLMSKHIRVLTSLQIDYLTSYWFDMMCSADTAALLCVCVCVRERKLSAFCAPGPTTQVTSHLAWCVCVCVVCVYLASGTCACT